MKNRIKIIEKTVTDFFKNFLKEFYIPNIYSISAKSNICI